MNGEPDYIDELAPELAWVDALCDDPLEDVRVVLLHHEMAAPEPYPRSAPRGLLLHVAPNFQGGLAPGKRVSVPTGIRVGVPRGYMGVLSSLGPRDELEIQPQHVFRGQDSDELVLKVANRGKNRVHVRSGAAIAVLSFVRIEQRFRVRWSHEPLLSNQGRDASPIESGLD